MLEIPMLIALFDDQTNTLSIDQEIYHALPALHQEALYWHEYFYWLARKNSAQNSDLVREYNAFMMADQPNSKNIELLMNLKAGAIKTTCNVKETATSFDLWDGKTSETVLVDESFIIQEAKQDFSFSQNLIKISIVRSPEHLLDLNYNFNYLWAFEDERSFVIEGVLNLRDEKFQKVQIHKAANSSLVRLRDLFELNCSLADPVL